MSDGYRRLAAIMFTDMVGYTALGQKDESLSLELVERQRKIVRPVLSKYHGREVKTIGDAFLVEFSNALDAVMCAYNIQKAIRDWNKSLPSQLMLHLRVGVHLGDVVDSQGDISGDAVNIASRIQSLAEDGGVCLTRQVHDQVENKVDFQLSSVGEKTLKNVNAPVEIYKIVMPWDTVTVQHQGSVDKRRIAVLPFSNMSPDSKDEYFADGMTEELITTMSKISGLKVIARTSVMGYKARPKKVSEIAEDLGVGTVLEGSVRKAGDKLRITVQLIDAKTSDHLWAESYDRELKDVFAIQTDISKTVAESLKVQLLSKEKSQIEKQQTDSPEAYMFYLKGRAHWLTRSEEGLNLAIKLFEEAIARDPQYALAYAGLADCYSILGVYGYRRAHSMFPIAKDLALRALALDEKIAEAHASLSEMMTHYYFDWAKADHELRRALELNPNFSQAHLWYATCLLAATGRLDEAIKEGKRAEELDPRSGFIASEVGRLYFFARRYDEAITQYKKAIELDPRSSLSHKNLADVYTFKGMFNEALEEIDKAVALAKGSVFILDDAGYVYAISGRKEEARKMLAQLDEMSREAYTPAFGRAVIYIGLGEKDKAMEWLEKAYEERSFMTWLKVHPIFDPIRDDHRFHALLEKVGLA